MKLAQIRCWSIKHMFPLHPENNLPNHRFQALMLIFGGVIDILIWRSGLSSCTTREKHMRQCWNMLEPTTDHKKMIPSSNFAFISLDPNIVVAWSGCNEYLSHHQTKIHICIYNKYILLLPVECPKNSPTKMWTELASSCKMPANKLAPNSLPAMFDQSSAPPAA